MVDRDPHTALDEGGAMGDEQGLHARLLSRVVWSAAAFAGVFACTHAPPLAKTDKPALVFDPAGRASAGPDAFFHTPFPSDARRLPSGAPAVQQIPNPGGIGFVKAAAELLEAEGNGADPSAAIYFRFDRPLPIASDVTLDTQRDVPGISILDIDPTSWAYGERIPALVRVTARHDGVRPAHLLQVLPVPGRGGFEGKVHAVIVDTDVDGDGDEDLAPSPAIATLLDTHSPHEEALARWHQSFAPLRDYLGRQQARSSLAAATVYTHGTPTTRLFRWVTAARKAAAPALAEPLKVVRDEGDYLVISGALKMPIYQRGQPPHFFGDGEIVVDDKGAPTVQRSEVAPFRLTLPKVSKGNVPLYFYIHGTGGLATQAIDRGFRATKDAVAARGSGLARWVADDGIATSCLAGPYSPDRVGWRALDGYGAYVFFNPRAMRDNFAQMLLEQAHFLQFLETTSIDLRTLERAPEVSKSDTPVWSAPVTLRPTIVGGQSLGSYLSGMFAALTGAFDAAILTGAGGSWIEFGFGPKNPVDLARVLDVVAAPKGESLDRFHPFISLFQAAVGPADNTHFTPYLVRRPPPVFAEHPALVESWKTPHVLIIEGEADLQVPTHLQRALVLSVGADLVGDDVGTSADVRLLPALRFGKLRTRTSAKNNLLTANGVERTVAALRYREDGILEGHYVVFQRPDATRQLTAFAKAVARGQTPIVHPPPRDVPKSRTLLGTPVVETSP